MSPIAHHWPWRYPGISFRADLLSDLLCCNVCSELISKYLGRWQYRNYKVYGSTVCLVLIYEPTARSSMCVKHSSCINWIKCSYIAVWRSVLCLNIFIKHKKNMMDSHEVKLFTKAWRIILLTSDSKIDWTTDRNKSRKWRRVALHHNLCLTLIRSHGEEHFLFTCANIIFHVRFPYFPSFKLPQNFLSITVTGWQNTAFKCQSDFFFLSAQLYLVKVLLQECWTSKTRVSNYMWMSGTAVVSDFYVQSFIFTLFASGVIFLCQSLLVKVKFYKQTWLRVSLLMVTKETVSDYMWL